MLAWVNFGFYTDIQWNDLCEDLILPTIAVGRRLWFHFNDENVSIFKIRFALGDSTTNLYYIYMKLYY